MGASREKDTQQLVLAYEQLRCEAVGSAGELHRGVGMVVLLREGMRRWMEAIVESQCFAQREFRSSSPSSVRLASAVRDEATQILVSMAMGR